MIRIYQASFFPSVWSKEAKTIRLENFIKDVRSERWKTQVERFREFRASKEQQSAASSIKSGMPAITAACLCKGGHQAASITGITGMAGLDFDHTGEHTGALFRKVCTLPYVVAAFISISGEGLKVFVEIGIEKQEQYPEAYRKVAGLLSQELGVESDAACKNINRLCFASYHPEAYFNPNAVPIQVNVPQVQTPQQPQLPEVSPAEFVQAYLSKHPAMPGSRNNTIFRLACEAKKRGIDERSTTEEVRAQLEQGDFGRREIESTVKSAYQNSGADTPLAKSQNTPQSLKVSLSYPASADPENEEEEDFGKSKGEALREQTPTIDEDVFNKIPGFFKECLVHTLNERERDILLLASITVVSAMLPEVTANYNRSRNWCNLFSVIIAPSGSSKGILTYAARLIKYYHEQWDKKNDEKQKAYDKALREYEDSYLEAKRNKKPFTGVKPSEPQMQYPLVPSQTSKSMLLTHLANNRKCGTLMFETEADTLTSANKRDYGDFNDIMRKSYHHEMVSNSYKTNARPIYVSQPCLSLFLSGTPSQMAAFTPSLENGLFSRLLTYTFSMPPQWIDVLSEEANMMDEDFDRLAMRMNNMALFLNQSPTRVMLTQGQRMRFTRMFKKLLIDNYLQGNDDIQSVVKRYGLMTMRICMIFTAIDKATMRSDTKEMYCSDDHFDAAMKIVSCCLEHSKLLATSLPESKDIQQELKYPNRLDFLLDSLPEVFSISEALESGKKLNIPRATVHRLLKNAIGLKIKRISRGVYRKDS